MQAWIYQLQLSQYPVIFKADSVLFTDELLQLANEDEDSQVKKIILDFKSSWTDDNSNWFEGYITVKIMQ